VLLGSTDVDAVVDQLEVARVEHEERDAVDVRGRGDGEVERASAGLSAAGADGRRESVPLARDRGVDPEDSNVASITPRRSALGARVRRRPSGTTRTPKCSSARLAALIAPFSSPG
jgi:hypothetical protein